MTVHRDASCSSLRNQNGPYSTWEEGEGSWSHFTGKEPSQWKLNSCGGEHRSGVRPAFLQPNHCSPQGGPSSFLPEAAWHCQQQGQQKSHNHRCGLASVTFGNWQKATSPENSCARFGAGAFCNLHEESLGNVLLQSPSLLKAKQIYSVTPSITSVMRQGPLPLVSSSCKQGTAWRAKVKASRLLGCHCHHCQHLTELFWDLAC